MCLCCSYSCRSLSVWWKKLTMLFIFLFSFWTSSVFLTPRIQVTDISVRTESPDDGYIRQDGESGWRIYPSGRRVWVTDISVRMESPGDGYICHSYFLAKKSYLEWISLRSRLVCAIMPTFRPPFSSCLTLAMDDSRERHQPAHCTTPNLDTTLQPSALTTPSSVQPGFYHTVIYREVAETKPQPLCAHKQ